MRFPNTERALAEIINDALDIRVVGHLPEDGYASAPFVQVTGLPTTAGPESFLRSDRVQINVYSTGRDSAKEYADQIHALMHGYHDTTHGFLDDIYPAVLPNEVPIKHDSVNLYTATYAVDTRPLKN